MKPLHVSSPRKLKKTSYLHCSEKDEDDDLKAFGSMTILAIGTTDCIKWF